MLLKQTGVNHNGPNSEGLICRLHLVAKAVHRPRHEVQRHLLLICAVLFIIILLALPGWGGFIKFGALWEEWARAEGLGVSVMGTHQPEVGCVAHKISDVGFT